GVKAAPVKGRRLRAGVRLLGALPGDDAVPNRPVPVFGAYEVVGELVAMFGQTLSMQLLESTTYRTMKLPAALAQKAAVRDFVGQRVLEAILQIGEKGCFVKELRRLKVAEAVAERLLGRRGDGLENCERHVHPNGRRGLQQALLVRGKPV